MVGNLLNYQTQLFRRLAKAVFSLLQQSQKHTLNCFVGNISAGILLLLSFFISKQPISGKVDMLMFCWFTVVL